jgi:hypothetical protein
MYENRDDGTNLLGPEGGLAEEPKGGLASRIMGGIGKMADAAESGIVALTSHPLYSRLWNGAMAAQTGDPMAGPKAIAELDYMRKKAAPTNADELNLLRIKHMNEADERARIDRERLDAARAKATDSTLSYEERRDALIRAGDYAGVAAIKPTPLELKPVGGPNGPVYATEQEAIGKPVGYAPHSPGWGLSYQVDANGNPVIQAGQGISPTQLKDAVSKRLNVSAILDNAEQLYGILDSAPGVAGAFGKIGKAGAGIAGAGENVGILPQGAGEFVAGKTTGGASQDQLSQYSTIGGALVARAKGLISADTGSVMSNQDIARLEEITSVKDWMTNDVQAKAALQTVTEIALKVEVENAVIQGLQSPYDPSTPEGAEALVVQLKRVGTSEANIDRILNELDMHIQNYRTTSPLRQPPKLPVNRSSLQMRGTGGTAP